MSDEIAEVLHSVAEQTFEQLAFLFPVPEDMAQVPADPESSGVRVRFSGPLEGELILSVSTASLPELVRSMLGLDDDDAVDAGLQHDALGELLNVVCGNLLPEIADSKAVFDLAAPELLEPGPPDQALAGRSPQGRARMSLDEGFVELILFYQPSA